MKEKKRKTRWMYAYWSIDLMNDGIWAARVLQRRGEGNDTCRRRLARKMLDNTRRHIAVFESPAYDTDAEWDWEHIDFLDRPVKVGCGVYFGFIASADLEFIARPEPRD